MMRAVGMIVGCLLMLAVFLLALTGGSAWPPVPTARIMAVEVPAGPEAVEDRPVADAVDGRESPVSVSAGPAEGTGLDAVDDGPALHSRPLNPPLPVPAEAPPVDAAERVPPPVSESAGPGEEPGPDAGDDGWALNSQSWNRSLAGYDTAVPEAAPKVSRYLLWTPFRSEWAAQGFARRLTQATAVPVEVISEGPGNYQVVFSYRDDAERQAMVAQIEDVTGLELE